MYIRQGKFGGDDIHSFINLTIYWALTMPVLLACGRSCSEVSDTGLWLWNLKHSFWPHVQQAGYRGSKRLDHFNFHTGKKDHRQEGFLAGHLPPQIGFSRTFGRPALLELCLAGLLSPTHYVDNTGSITWPCPPLHASFADYNISNTYTF